MTKKCIVCGIYYRAEENRSFHRWPFTRTERELWLLDLGIQNIDISSKYIYICSDHFSPEDFYMQYWKEGGFRRLLTADAKPKCYLRSENVQAECGEAVQPKSDILTHRSLSDSSSTLTASEKEIFQTPPKRRLAKRELSHTNYSPSSTISEIEDIPFDTVSPLSKRIKLTASQQSIGSLDLSETVSCSSSATLTASSSTLSASETRQLDQSSNAQAQTQELEAISVVPSTSIRRSKLPRYPGELTIDDFSSPKRARKSLQVAKDAITALRKRVINLKQSRNRYRSRVRSLQSLLSYLKDNKFISVGAVSNIQESVADSSKELISKLLQGPRRQKYVPELRSFAMTLHFYSPKAYRYVRDKFNSTLPHPVTISKWYSKLDGKPGFTEESLQALKIKTAEAEKKGVNIICSLVLDEVAIRKQVEWDGKQYHGFIDIGTKIDSDNIPEATEALVLMLVGVNTNWKIPIGYFLINGLTGKEKANIVNRALKFISATKITVCSVTFDGAPSNLNMATCLGADYSDPKNLKTFFLHPKTQQKIYLIMDPSHMLKLIRNCFGSYSILEDSEGNQICWQYLKHLFEVQTCEGLTAANKLKKRHLEYWREKMKVKLASQTLSKSVSDALGFFRDDIDDNLIRNKFKGSEATQKFLLYFNDCFDIMNSSGRYATYKFKRALSEQTESYIFERLADIREYILGLKYSGKSILQTGRKCGFLGMLINIESIKNIYMDFVKNDSSKLKYLLVYKLSQDHLEIFFSAIRSRGGNNNNPTAKQFQSAYKKLLAHIEVKGADTGNATAIDSTSILHCSSATKRITENENGDNLLFSEEHKKIETLIQELDFINSSAWHLTTSSEDIIKYISGFVGRSLTKCISCEKCLNSLKSNEPASLLQKRKTFENAKMFCPSKLLIDICMLGERSFRVVSNQIDIFNNRIENLIDILLKATFKNIPLNLLDYFGDHVFDFEPLSTHFTDLIKLSLKKYFNIRIHHETRKRLDKNIGNRVRSVLTKTIIFKNQ